MGERRRGERYNSFIAFVVINRQYLPFPPAILMSKRRILVRKISTLLPYAVGESLQYSLVNLMHGKMQVNWPVEPVLLLVQHLVNRLMNKTRGLLIL